MQRHISVHSIASHLSTLSCDRIIWIGLSGAPGSGKSTLANRLRDEFAPDLTVIPMDGYHLTRKQLSAFPKPDEAFARRGAPHTFDAARFVKDIKLARETSTGVFPGFDHGAGDPVADSIELKNTARFVVVEGNYLLLEDEPWCDLNDLFDESWFLNTPLRICCDRVFRRHLSVGRSRIEAETRVSQNDLPNGRLVQSISLARADVVIDSDSVNC